MGAEGRGEEEELVREACSHLPFPLMHHPSDSSAHGPPVPRDKREPTHSQSSVPQL